MNASFHSLAAQIPEDLPGPVLVIGMAETAVGLGAGVHRAFSATRPDTVYMVSTRHPTGNELFARFEEEHSHASAHLIHLPVDPDVREMMLNARSLVLVDDEASTGKTFINLHRALVDAGLTQVERVVTCVLTDWSGDAVRKTIGDSAHQVSLLQGSYTFHEDAEAPLPEMPAVGTIEPGEWPLTAESDWGRHGIRVVEDTLALDLNVKAGERVLVVGTSEFVWRPFLLAERLERAGADVHFSSTSSLANRSGPCHRSTYCLFADNYGLGIPNFLYNVSPGQFDRVLICSETPVQAVSASLIESLNAEVIVDGQ